MLIAERDMDLAAKRMRQHLSTVGKNLLDSMDSGARGRILPSLPLADAESMVLNRKAIRRPAGN